jgi:hypothetical protein
MPTPFLQLRTDPASGLSGRAAVQIFAANDRMNQLFIEHLDPAAGLAESAARCAEMLAEALGGDGRVPKFHRDGWAQPSPEP